MKTSAPVMAPFLRSEVQGRLLALVFGDPKAERTLTEMAEIVGTSLPTAHREMKKAEKLGLVRSRQVGQARVITVNPNNRFYEPLSQIIIGAFGAPAVVAKEFSNLEGVVAILIFGSWAARSKGHPGPMPGDVDVLVIGTPDRDSVYRAADRAESAVGIPIQTTIRSASEWASGDPFIQEIRNRPFVVLEADSSEPAVADLAFALGEEK